MLLFNSGQNGQLFDDGNR